MSDVGGGAEESSAKLLLRLENEDFTDVTLKCNDGEIKCHRLILAVHSTVFEHMLKSGFKESVDGQVEMELFSHSVLHKGVRFMYGAQLNLTGDTVDDFLRLADMYEISSLVKVCEEYLVSHINLNVVIALREQALHYNFIALADKCLKYCLKNFKDVLTTNGFLKANKEAVISVLSDRNLKVRHEDAVFEALMTWLVHDHDNRASSLTEIIEKCLRVKNVTHLAVHNCLEMHLTHFNDVSKVALLSLLQDIIGVRDVREILPPRAMTEMVDCLRVCLNNPRKIGIMELVQAGSELSCVSHHIIFPNVSASKVWDFGSRVFVYQKAPRLLYHRPTGLLDSRWYPISLRRVLVDLIKFDSNDLISIEQTNDGDSYIRKVARLDMWYGGRVLWSTINTVVSGPLSWHVYGIYAIVFSFSATHLHFKVLDRRTHLWFEPECSGSFERSLRGQFCSSTNGNIACLVTCDAILLFYMDELIRVYLSKSSPTRDKCFEERTVPGLPSGRRFC